MSHPHPRLLAVLLLAALTAGCNVGGALAYKVFGPNKEPAEYAPPKDQPLVVLVENYRNLSALQQQSDQLAEMITGKLAIAKVAPVISTDTVIALRTEHTDAFAKMKIPDIGRAVGAKKIIYVNLKECSIEGVIGAPDVKCKIDAFVKVVDADSGKTLWPDVGDGREFKRETDYNPSEGHRTEDTIRDAVLDDLSMEIALLFFPHQPDNEMPKD